MIELRDYQLDAIERCRREVARGRKRVILLAATGSGKTVIASSIVSGAVEKGKRVLFLAHRRELVTQAARKLFDAGIDAGIVLPGFTPRPEQLVQVASIQSLTARAIRTATMDMPPADLIVVDECHHATAATYRAILAAYPGVVLLGLSATPARADAALLICDGPVAEALDHVAAHFDQIANPADDFEGYAVGRFIDALRSRLAASSQSTPPAETPPTPKDTGCAECGGNPAIGRCPYFVCDGLDPLVEAMRRHWRAGKRGAEFHAAVRDQFPWVGVQTYNRGADLAWGSMPSDHPNEAYRWLEEHNARPSGTDGTDTPLSDV